MPQTLYDALDGAQLVRVRDDPHSYETLAVWHGGHTINTYQVSALETSKLYVTPETTRSVGDYETGEVTEETVESAIKTIFNEREDPEEAEV